MLTNDVVALYDALGGGWQEDAATSQAPVIATTLPHHPRGPGQPGRVTAARPRREMTGSAPFPLPPFPPGAHCPHPADARYTRR